MLQLHPGRATHGSLGPDRFVLYVEGPRDRGILREWAYRLLPTLARRVFHATVILGGRRPARALEHFRDAYGGIEGARGVCVLDRDHGATSLRPEETEPGLEFFTWSRRHIESYLLDAEAIRRALSLREDDARVGRVLREHLPLPGDEEAYREVDAKQLLGPRGALARALGRPIPVGRIARLTPETRLHADVHALFARVRLALGVVDEPKASR